MSDTDSQTLFSPEATAACPLLDPETAQRYRDEAHARADVAATEPEAATEPVGER